MKKLLIFGCGGMLGRSAIDTFSKNYEVKCTDIDVNESWLTYQDVSNFDSVKELIDDFKPDIVLNLAAKTDLEWCESNQSETYLVNSFSSNNLVRICNDKDILYIFISTAGVFDGEADFYTDYSTPNPVNTYGNSKYIAEQYITTNCKKYFIFRAGWMMGGGWKDKKFISKIYKQIANGATELNIVNDKYGTPTFTKDFLKNIKYVVESTTPYSIYNLVCSGDGNRHDICKFMLEELNNKDIILNEVDSSFFNKDYSCIRPKCEKLINQKLNDLNMNFMNSWKQSLHEYMQSSEFKEII